MCRRITEEWNRPGIVQVVDLTPATPVISADGPTTFCQGGSVTLSVNTPETGVTYHWSNNATGNAITVTTAGSYSCFGQSSSTCTGGTSNIITVVVNPLVVVTTQPTSVTVLQGQPFTLTCAGSNVISYQWYHGTTAISGATSASYSVSVATLADAGSYYCELTNGCGSVNTNTVTVTVTPLMLTIDPQSVTVSASSGNTSFVITSNESWSIVTSDPLVIATPSSGAGNSTINVSYPAINTMAGETYTVTVTSNSNIVETFTINQDGVSAFITLTPDNANVPATAGSLQFSVDCPSDLIWDVTGLASWLSAAPLSGMGPGTVTLNYEANTDPTSRSDDFSVSGSGATDVFSITQVGQGAPLQVTTSASATVVTLGASSQLFASPAGGTGNYTFLWTGPGGFSSTEQNPVVTPPLEGENLYHVEVSDGETSAGSDEIIEAYEVSFYLEATPMNGTTDDEFLFHSEIIQNPNDPRTVDYHSIEFGDGDMFEGSGSIVETSHQYLLAGIYDVEQSYVLSDGSTDSKTNLNFIGVITDVRETEPDNFKIYPNPTSGSVFINAGKSVERLSVINMTGSEVIHQENLGENARIDLSTLPSGLYFVRIYVDGVFTTQKVVKE
ncbi:MAG: hypothetical protein A2338_02210 [Bacteroidetes bacterium RIFOXYB12_FULL_41_6]|nr:MAG: hypothetical protein A2338_02210 [Bacteroidetes bacterium RIFOXYB12_FULL_41_6]